MASNIEFHWTHRTVKKNRESNSGNSSMNESKFSKFVFLDSGLEIICIYRLCKWFFIALLPLLALRVWTFKFMLMLQNEGTYRGKRAKMKSTKIRIWAKGQKIEYSGSAEHKFVWIFLPSSLCVFVCVFYNVFGPLTENGKMFKLFETISPSLLSRPFSAIGT